MKEILRDSFAALDATSWRAWLIVLVAAAAAAIAILFWRAVGKAPARSDSMQGRIEQGSAVVEPGNSDPEETVGEAADPFEEQRRRMVDVQIASREVDDPRVLEAMRRVPRHRFVPTRLWDSAYADHPLPIGEGQTISQPYIVALMSQLARTTPTAKALDVGTGSGYQAAILGELCREVYSIEIVPALAEESRLRLAEMGYRNVEVRCGDGYRGWPERAPFDVIIVAAAPGHVPQSLIDQLAAGGRLVIPVGRYYQDLIVVEKSADGAVRQEKVAPVAFVPMTGEAQRQ